MKPDIRDKVKFIKQDIRDKSIKGPFHLVFCRNLAFTYFDHSLQREMLAHFHQVLVQGGALVIGGHESLPDGYSGFEPWSMNKAIFRKTAGNEC